MPVDHYENFPVASILMPRRLRKPVAAIYHFARAADDIADEGDLPDAERLRRLDGFRAKLKQIEAKETPQDALFARLAAEIAAHALPMQPLYDLLDAFSQDVVQKRYASFDELRDYCSHSADPVGRLLLHLYCEVSEVTLTYSDAICTALQLINFWQDVAKDWAIGRVYLPQEDLARFGVSETQIAASHCDDNWRALMQFEVQRARALMLSGKPLGTILRGRIGLEMRMIIQGGLRILDKLEAVDYDMFHRRPILRPHDWVIMLAKSAPF